MQDILGTRSLVSGFYATFAPVRFVHDSFLINPIITLNSDFKQILRLIINTERCLSSTVQMIVRAVFAIPMNLDEVNSSSSINCFVSTNIRSYYSYDKRNISLELVNYNGYLYIPT